MYKYKNILGRPDFIRNKLQTVKLGKTIQIYPFAQELEMKNSHYTVKIYLSPWEYQPLNKFYKFQGAASQKMALLPILDKYNFMDIPNVLFLTYEFDDLISGGIGRVINGLSIALTNKVKFDVFLFRWSDEIENFSGDLFTDGKTKESFQDDYRVRILNIITQNQYNIIHILHVGEHTYEVVKLLKETNVNVQIIYSAHSISKFEKNIRKNSDENLVHEEYIVHNSDHLHLLSDTGKKWMIESYPNTVTSKKFHVIPNAIEFPQHMRTQEVDSKIILCMSRWSHGKGIEYLIAAVPDVLKIFPEAKFIIAGRKINSWEHDVHTYIKQLDTEIEKLSHAVSSIGWIDDEEKDKLIAQASVCVMPSELEYFPYAILEPVAAGLPVISSRIPSVQDMVVENKDCLMFEMANSSELAEKIIQLLSNPGAGHKFSRNAYKTISKKYTWERVSKEYANMYKQVLA